MEGIHWNHIPDPTGWHHDDVAPDGLVHLKVVFALEPTTFKTGCLHLLPGSRAAKVRAELERAVEACPTALTAQGAGLAGAVGVEAAVGDAVVFDIKTYHSAWGDGTAHRRGLYLNFVQRPQSDDDHAYCHKLYCRDGKDLGLAGLGGNNMYYPSLFDSTVRRLPGLASGSVRMTTCAESPAGMIHRVCVAGVCPAVEHDAILQAEVF